ncbi:MAG TPA: CRISPR system precrRNA processing endoribonuclease RAMP protein Cas6 [Nitrospirae bacterium]|nr:CRISPR system precrRNA processing endoribonuclease RAMP protein Cas6 [Nitrospirota bacterium]
MTWNARTFFIPSFFSKGLNYYRNLKWYDWERYSARQETKMKMGGFVGEITFEGDIEPFMPILKAGEVLHVGKGTGFGLGKYKSAADLHG